MLSKYSEEHLGFEVYSRTESRRRNDFERGGKHIDLYGMSVMNLYSALNMLYMYIYIYIYLSTYTLACQNCRTLCSSFCQRVSFNTLTRLRRNYTIISHDASLLGNRLREIDPRMRHTSRGN